MTETLPAIKVTTPSSTEPGTFAKATVAGLEKHKASALEEQNVSQNGRTASPSNADVAHDQRRRKSTPSRMWLILVPTDQAARTRSSPKATSFGRDSEADMAQDKPDIPQGSPIDPLSHHLIHRATIPSPSSKAKSQFSSSSDMLGLGGSTEPLSRKTSAEDAAVSTSPQPKEKKKGVSFLSRIVGNKKRSSNLEPPQVLESAEEDGSRQAGADAEAFYDSFDNLSFSPQVSQPPRYIRVQAQGTKGFSRLFLAQTLHADDEDGAPAPLQRVPTSSSTSSRLRKARPTEANATWALEFSRDGKHIALAGQDKAVRVWKTLASPEDRKQYRKEEEEDDSSASGLHLNAPVFQERPVRVFRGHTEPVLDLTWSKNNFLLSSSMDKTVRLWHISRTECLCTFKHSDFVTSIQFHPQDDRFFLAGSLDAKLRLWSIPDKSVAFWNSVPEMITAVAFTPDGKTAIAGCVNGLCLFYETEGFKYQTQVNVKSARGKNAKGSKITGIKTMNFPPNSDTNGNIKLLITSNDSRIRLYNFRDKSLEMKFKGTLNSSSQIHASFSDCGRYIICGSEDNRVFIWPLNITEPDDRRRPVAVFEAHSAATTVCAIAPSRTRKLLGASEDPIYDVCNPPPVTLVSRSEIDSIKSSSEEFKGLGSTSRIEPTNRADESPAYISRSLHHDGHAIVTADAAGNIRVFRQDCAFQKRMQWEPSRKFSASGVRHQTSRSSKASLNRQDSGSTAGAPRERVLSWRQSVGSLNSVESSQQANRRSKTFQRGQPRTTSPGRKPSTKSSHRSSLMTSPTNGSRSSVQASTPPSETQSDRKGSADMPLPSHLPHPRKSGEHESRLARPFALPTLPFHLGHQNQERHLNNPQDQRLQHQKHNDEQSERDDERRQSPEVNSPRPEGVTGNKDETERPNIEARSSSWTFWHRDAWKAGLEEQIKTSEANREALKRERDLSGEKHVHRDYHHQHGQSPTRKSGADHEFAPKPQHFGAHLGDPPSKASRTSTTSTDGRLSSDSELSVFLDVKETLSRPSSVASRATSFAASTASRLTDEEDGVASRTNTVDA